MNPAPAKPLTVAIIGAGPAGAAVAFHLAHAGFHTHIFESRAFPRPKVCGEFLSPSITPLLEAILPADTLRSHGAKVATRFVLEVGDRRTAWNIPTPAWSLSRLALDALLLDAARDAGATLHQPAAVAHVAYHDSHVEVACADGTRLAADLVIHADGSGRHDPAGPLPAQPGLIGLKCHFQAPAGALPHLANAVCIRSCPGAYVGTIHVEKGHSTCALVARAALLANNRINRDDLLQSLWPAFDPAWRSSDWLACPVPRSRPITSGHPRSFRIGNAAAAVDPIGGEGMGLALWSAQELARLLIRGLSPATHPIFARRYRARIRTRLPACALAAACLMRPAIVRAAWPLLALPSLTLAPWYAATGKRLRPE